MLAPPPSLMPLDALVGFKLKVKLARGCRTTGVGLPSHTWGGHCLRENNRTKLQISGSKRLEVGERVESRRWEHFEHTWKKLDCLQKQASGRWDCLEYCRFELLD